MTVPNGTNARSSCHPLGCRAIPGSSVAGNTGEGILCAIIILIFEVTVVAVHRLGFRAEGKESSVSFFPVRGDS